jgi:CheY-like chemotaxis protein
MTNILLADDDKEDQELLREALLQEQPSASIETVWNGQEVISYLNACPDDALPCLVILDYKMPFLSAAEVLERLFKDARYAAIPKVVWSTSSQREHIDRCLKNGAVHYFTKPNSPSELTSMTKRMLSLCYTTH